MMTKVLIVTAACLVMCVATCLGDMETGKLVSKVTRVKRDARRVQNLEENHATQRRPAPEDAECWVEYVTTELRRLPGMCHSIGRLRNLATCVSGSRIAFVKADQCRSRRHP